MSGLVMPRIFDSAILYMGVILYLISFDFLALTKKRAPCGARFLI